jgi:hypothetical protein
MYRIRIDRTILLTPRLEYIGSGYDEIILLMYMMLCEGFDLDEMIMFTLIFLNIVV